jgi:ubiquinone/menaquinone biosynthesis C-methylase UbiE
VAETEEQRSKRHQRRTLFDGVADLYAASRPGYPGEIIEFLTATAGVGQGSSVLEVGCGTGQLTNGLAHYGFDLTAIDIGPALVAAAQDRLAEASISFQVCSFEDFAAADASFDLIISATAFHWVDPEVKFSKSAQLLRPSGWLALLSTERLYVRPTIPVTCAKVAAMRSLCEPRALVRASVTVTSEPGHDLLASPATVAPAARLIHLSARSGAGAGRVTSPPQRVRDLGKRTGSGSPSTKIIRFAWRDVRPTPRLTCADGVGECPSMRTAEQ